MEYIYIIIISLVISIILLFLRFIITKIPFLDNVLNGMDDNEKSMIVYAIGWCIIMYGLILAFSISNFYDRYITIRDTLIDESTNLELIYSYFKRMPDSEKVLTSIKNYVENIDSKLVSNLSTKQYDLTTITLYNKMNDTIIDYIAIHQDNVFNTDILSRMSTYQKIKKLTADINTGTYYLNLLMVLIIFILLLLFLINLKNKIIQLIIDFCLLVIILTGIYICYILNNPFISSPVKLSLTMYNDLLNDINKSEEKEKMKKN